METTEASAGPATLEDRLALAEHRVVELEATVQRMQIQLADWAEALEPELRRLPLIRQAQKVRQKQEEAAREHRERTGLPVGQHHVRSHLP